MSYENSANIQFTFNTALSVSVSGDLLIEELAPGYASDSNIITVDVDTNNSTGYNLYATVGNSTTYDNTDLNFTSGSIQNNAPKFTSLNTTDNVSDLANLSNNTWGYSYSIDNGTTWVSGNKATSSAGYSGLPLYTNEGTIINSASSAAETTTNFKIAAKAASSQIAGSYNNVINFTAITNRPLVSFYDAFTSAGKTMYNDYFKMQDMTTSICEAVEMTGEDSQTKLIDIRDNNTYWVAKLADNNCWMTQNLDFAPDTTKTYTYYDTDLGHTNSDTAATWQPNNTLANPAKVTNFASGSPSNSVSGWTGDSSIPYYAEGRYYSSGTGFTDEIIVYNGTKYQGLQACTAASHTQTQCEHYQIGNYYNWPAAIASNNASSITAKYTVAPDSVCPAGWRLPNGLTKPDGTVIQSEFNALLSAANIGNGTDLAGDGHMSYTTDGWSLINTEPYYFVRSGHINNTTLNNFTVRGYYSSSTAISADFTYYMYYESSLLIPSYQHVRLNGWPVRCLAR